MAKNDYVSLFRRNEHQLISDKMQKAADAKGLDTDILLFPLQKQINI